jgi:alcohol dehydrogenase class IV
MWYFRSPEIVFGEDALSHLEQIQGQRAFIVTDANLVHLGFAAMVQDRLKAAGIATTLFSEVEPDPSLQTVRRCAAAMTEYNPDWVIGLGGGSCMDAAKAAWLLYECPGADPAAINPFDRFGLRARARLIAIPTTSGTGAEVTMVTVLTDKQEQRKLGLASGEIIPDIAIVDPVFVRGLPAQITADTGLDALTHAIEGYTSSYHNDFTDGLCLRAIQLVFEYLPVAYAGGGDAQAREHMHNAATIAGLGFGNAMPALAHAMGHALGALFPVPHGRAVSLFLPYTIQFSAQAEDTRYGDIVRFMGWSTADESAAVATLVNAIRDLQSSVDQPRALSAAQIGAEAFEAALPRLVENAESDTSLIMGTRIPDSHQLERLFRCAFSGRAVDF